MGDISYGPLILSIKVASIATLIVFITGTVLARLFARHEFPGKTVIEALFLFACPPTNCCWVRSAHAFWEGTATRKIAI